MYKQITILLVIVGQSLTLFLTFFSTVENVLSQLARASQEQREAEPLIPKVFISICDKVQFVGVEFVSVIVFVLSLLGGGLLFILHLKQRTNLMEMIFIYISCYLVACQLLLALWLLTTNFLKYPFLE